VTLATIPVLAIHSGVEAVWIPKKLGRRMLVMGKLPRSETTIGQFWKTICKSPIANALKVAM
jgi:hypothetical protein